MARNLKAFLLKNAMISDSVTTAGAAATTRAAYSSGMVPYTAYNNIVLTTGSLNVVLSTFGIVANLINLRTFGAMGGVVVDGVTLTLFTLSLSDLGLCVSSLCWIVSWSCYTVEHRLITLHGRGFYFSVDPRALGIFFANVMSVFSVTTTLITIYLAMMRCLCVIFPLRFRDSISPAITALTFGMFFLVALSTRLPMLALMDIRPRFDPNTNLTRFTIWSHPDRQLVRDVTRSLVDFPLPVIAEVILTICVIVMVRALRASRKFRNVSTADVKFSSPEQPSSTHGTDHCSASSSEGKSSTGKSPSSSGASVSSGKPSPRTTNTHKVTVSGASTPSGKPSQITTNANNATASGGSTPSGKPRSRTTNTNNVTASGASVSSGKPSPRTTNTNNVPASGGSTPSGKLSPKESRVVKQLVIISFIFIACNLPKLARIIADSVEPEFAMSGCYRNLYDIASQVQFTAETLNSSVNLFIYLSFNARFRQKCHLPRLCK
ncbi:hypothetical protein RRG08_050425 [Elysia crispata]|uniref:G-protein coupled receptors family 1 profile domain-containing protein n=1 Tax=Elysia crispata TaxID=231223 RepID=A0AAE1DHY2_9GAST|nr:hypothetical protein RRG08_050425 [Elysia crispata]